jgi:hypothetical protein
VLGRARVPVRRNVRLCADIPSALAIARLHIAALSPSLRPSALDAERAASGLPPGGASEPNPR